MLVIKNIFLYIKNLLLRIVELKLVRDIRDHLYKHIQTLSLGYFHKRHTGSITSIVMNDVEQLQIALGVVFQRLFVEPINILTFVTLLFIISWKLAIIAIIIIPLAGFAIIGIGRSIRRKSRRTQQKIAEIMQILTETLSSRNFSQYCRYILSATSGGLAFIKLGRRPLFVSAQRVN